MPVLKGFGSLDAIPAEQINDKTMRKFISGEQGMLVAFVAMAAPTLATA